MIPGRRKRNQPRKLSGICSQHVGDNAFHLRADAPTAQFTTSPPQDGFAVASLGRRPRNSDRRVNKRRKRDSRLGLNNGGICPSDKFSKICKKVLHPPRPFAKRALPRSM